MQFTSIIQGWTVTMKELRAQKLDRAHQIHVATITQIVMPISLLVMLATPLVAHSIA